MDSNGVLNAARAEPWKVCLFLAESIGMDSTAEAEPQILGVLRGCILLRRGIRYLLLPLQPVPSGPSLQRSIDRAYRGCDDTRLPGGDSAGRRAGAKDRCAAAPCVLLCGRSTSGGSAN